MIEPIITKLKQQCPDLLDIYVPTKEGYISVLTFSGDEDSSEGQAHLEERVVAGQLQMIVGAHDVAKEQALLTTLSQEGGWSDLGLSPVILTESEHQAIQAAQSGETYSARQAIDSLLKKTHDPYVVRRHLLAILNENKRVLDGIELEFPTSGTQALCVVRKLEVLFQQIVEWTFALYERPFQGSLDEWSYFEAQFCGAGRLYRRQMALVRGALQALRERHTALSPLMTQTYGDNDLEFEEIVYDLSLALKQLREQVMLRYQVHALEKRRSRLWMIVLASVFSLAAVGAVGGYVYWWSSFLQPVKLSKAQQAAVGGVIGHYYRGTRFETFMTRRTDVKIDMLWPRSPAAGLKKDAYSVRWEGFLHAPQQGKYTFCARYDDGVRFQLGGVDIVNDRRPGKMRTKCRVVQMRPGWHPVKVEYTDYKGLGYIKLLWKPPFKRKLQSIDKKRYCCRK